MASLDTVNTEKKNPESQENDEVCTFILPLPSKINAQVNRACSIWKRLKFGSSIFQVYNFISCPTV